MTGFFGKGTGKKDDKGRLVLPAVFKAALAPLEDKTLVVKKDIYADCLEMYTFEEWQRQAEGIRASLDIVFNREHAAFWRRYMSDCATVVPDDKFGRITIPGELLDKIGVNKEVVFAGVGYKIEVWAKERREAGLISDNEYQLTAEKLSHER